jgi:predicted AlkP superfamily phosphohydrolase/phosphomutase
MAAGRLPTFARLVAEGWSGTLRSFEPTLSPVIWTTIATGKSPPQHGIEGFLARADGGDEVPVTSNLRRAETLWTIASRYGRRVNVIGWYVTWPVETVNGVMVSDRFVPEERGKLVGGPASLTGEHPGVYPASLGPDLERFFVRAERFIDPYERQFHSRFKGYPVDATRTAIAEHLMQASPADLTMVYIWGTDPIQHHFWKYYQPQTWPGPPPARWEIEVNRDRVPAYYADVDSFVARLLARTGPRDTVLIVSDHGAGPVATYDPDKPLSGDHRLEGIIVTAGNHVRRGTAEQAPSVMDIAPTVLYLLGLPVGRDMEGRVIHELVDPAFYTAHPPATIPTYEPVRRRANEAPVASPMDDEIKDRLRALGYVE